MITSKTAKFEDDDSWIVSAIDPISTGAQPEETVSKGNMSLVTKDEHMEIDMVSSSTRPKHIVQSYAKVEQILKKDFEDNLFSNNDSIALNLFALQSNLDIRLSPIINLKKLHLVTIMKESSCEALNKRPARNIILPSNFVLNILYGLSG